MNYQNCKIKGVYLIINYKHLKVKIYGKQTKNISNFIRLNRLGSD